MSDDILERLARVESITDERDRRYMERFVAQERAVDSALTSAEKAVKKAEQASEKRFESVNEFRAALSDQTNQLMRRSEIEPLIDALEKRMNLLENWRSKATGAGIVLTFIAGAIGAAIVKAFGG